MMKRLLFLITIIMLMISCTTTGEAEPDTIQGEPQEAPAPIEEESFYEEIERLTNSRIGLYHTYDGMIPEIINDLKNCRMLFDNDSANIVSGSTAHVHAYAAYLEENGCEDADAATIGNELYWKAFFTLTSLDITALMTRASLLIRDGYLARAEMLLLFCAYDHNMNWDRDLSFINQAFADIYAITDETTLLIEEGIIAWDAGDREKALALYREAMELYPKSPWALWELGLDHFTENPEDIPEYYKGFCHNITVIDPNYEVAYYPEFGKNGDKIDALTMEVLPAKQKLWAGEDIMEQMLILGDGYFRMQEYEMAIYAYKYLLFHNFTGTFDLYLKDQLQLCLEGLGMEELNPYLREWLASIEVYMGLNSLLTQ